MGNSANKLCHRRLSGTSSIRGKVLKIADTAGNSWPALSSQHSARWLSQNRMNRKKMVDALAAAGFTLTWQAAPSMLNVRFSELQADPLAGAVALNTKRHKHLSARLTQEDTHVDEDQYIIFYDNYEAPLDRGSYRFVLQQTVNLEGDAARHYYRDQKFAVLAPRYAIEADEIQAYFPPGGGIADYRNESAAPRPCSPQPAVGKNALGKARTVARFACCFLNRTGSMVTSYSRWNGCRAGAATSRQLRMR